MEVTDVVIFAISLPKERGQWGMMGVQVARSFPKHP